MKSRDKVWAEWGEQWKHMAMVVGYIERHLAQGGPDEVVEHSAWRYSLMNWGHDPLDH